MGNFKDMMLRADTFKQISLSPEDSEFWVGYMRGLRVTHHENFGTEEDHEKWAGIESDCPDLVRRARGEGYRAGIAKIDPIWLFNSLQNAMTTRQLAEAAGVAPSRIRQIADQIPGGRKTETGWKFPEYALDWVKSQPPPGRKKKS